MLVIFKVLIVLKVRRLKTTRRALHLYIKKGLRTFGTLRTLHVLVIFKVLLVLKVRRLKTTCRALRLYIKKGLRTFRTLRTLHVLFIFKVLIVLKVRRQKLRAGYCTCILKKVYGLSGLSGLFMCCLSLKSF